MEADGDLPGQSECSNSSVVASVAWGAEAQERVGPHVHYGERRAVRRIARPGARCGWSLTKASGAQCGASPSTRGAAHGARFGDATARPRPHG